MSTGPTISSRVSRVRERMTLAAQKCGRSAEEVQLLAVTKTRSVSEIRELLGCGLSEFGENRISEANVKMEMFPQVVGWHMIGHLQSNKVRDCGGFGCVQSVDRAKIVTSLEQLSVNAAVRLRVLLEVNTGGEEQKGGTRTWDDLLALADELLKCTHLNWEGLMTMAPFSPSEVVVRPCFARLFELRERLRARFPEQALPLLSMGMSNDFEWAIQEGSTMVRIGTLLFEDRP